MAGAGSKGSSKASAEGLATGCHNVPGSGQQLAALKPQSVSNAAPRRDVLRAWPRKTDNYSIKASAGADKCTACKGQHSLTRRNGEAKPSSKLIGCKKLYKKKHQASAFKANC